MTFKEIFSSPSIMGLLGVIIGSSISLISNWLMVSKEAKLRILEKNYDRKVEAHERILIICQELRSTITTETADSDGNVITYPTSLQSREHLENLILTFHNIVNVNVHLIDIEIYRYLNYIQDYLASLHISLKPAPNLIYPQVAIILKQDFIDLASELHDLTTNFFDKGPQKLTRKTKRGHHKFKRQKTESMLAGTKLRTEWEQIEKKITEANNG